MGNVSEHFSNRDFICKCGACGGQVRIHLGLVGALEAIAEHFRKIPRIAEAYRCEIVAEKTNLPKKNAHRMGKAAHISIEGVSLPELFKFAEEVPEIRGLGYYVKENVVHIDTRQMDVPGTKDKWIKDGTKIIPLTDEVRPKFGL